MILGRKHIYLPHAQTATYDSKVKIFLKQGISHQLSRDAVVRFECENSAILTTLPNCQNTHTPDQKKLM
jgi:hypothetical protein